MPAKGWEPIRLVVPAGTKEKLEAIVGREGHASLQALLGPVVVAVARGEVRQKVVQGGG